MRFIFIGIGVAVMLLLQACSATNKGQKQAENTKQEIPEHVLKTRFVTTLLKGHAALLRGDYKTARQAFVNCQNLQPENAEALYRFSQTEQRLGNQEQALDLAEKSVKFNTENIVWYDLHFAELLQARGETKKAAEHLQKTLNKHSQTQFLYPKTDSMWRSVKNYKKSERVWVTYKLNFPNKPALADEYLTDIYLLQNRKEEALNTAKSLFEADGTNGNYVLKYSQVLAGTGSKKELEEILTRYASDNQPLTTHKTDFYKEAYYLAFDAGFPEPALSYAKKQLTGSVGQGNSNMDFIRHLITAVNNNFFDKLSLVEILKEAAGNQQENTELQLLTGIQLLKENKITEAVSFFENCLALGMVSHDFYLAYCRALLYAGRISELAEIAETASIVYPFSKELSLFEQIARKSPDMEVFNNLEKLPATAKPLAYYTVLLYENSKFPLPAEPSGEYTASADHIILGALWLLNRNEPEKAVEMLKKEAISLKENPLFCRVFSIALQRVGQHTEAKNWNEKTVDTKMDKDLLHYLNNGKDF